MIDISPDHNKLIHFLITLTLPVDVKFVVPEKLHTFPDEPIHTTSIVFGAELTTENAGSFDVKVSPFNA